MKIGKFLVAAIALAVIFVMPVSAGVLTEPEAFQPLTTTDWTTSLAFPLFNPALGTLTRIELDIDGAFQTVLTVTNNASSSSYGTADTEMYLEIQDPGLHFEALVNGPPPANAPWYSPALTLITLPDYGYSLASGGSTTSGTLSASDSATKIYTSSAILTEFTGVGTIDLTAFTQTKTLLGNTGGDTVASQVTHASADATITYTYTDASNTPEPASMGLIGIGLAGFALWQRRRNRAV